MNADLKPISLDRAAKILAERYPEWAFDRLTLRRMCIARKIPYISAPITSPTKFCSFRVRLAELLSTFRSWERPSLKY